MERNPEGATGSTDISLGDVIPRSRKKPRSYIKKKRTGMRHVSGGRAAARALLLNAPSEWLEDPSTSCCSRSRCKEEIPLPTIQAAREKLAPMNDADRKLFLRSLKISGPVHSSNTSSSSHRTYFALAGVRLCDRFLKKAFLFSNDVIYDVKGTAGARGPPINGLNVSRSTRPARQRDRTIAAIRQLAEVVGQFQPDNGETHLPFVAKKIVYERVCRIITRIATEDDEGLPLPSESYFYDILAHHAPKVKVRKVHRFTKCTDCEQIRQLLAAENIDKPRAAAIRRQHAGHIDMMQNERGGYRRRRDRARYNPDECMSVIIDGADQKAFDLPHFVHTWKDVTGHGMKVRLIGVKEHTTPDKIDLYLMTEEYETGANHIVEVLHRTLSNKRRTSKIPPILFIQADNCTRENKNTFFFSYCESLVAWGVFREVHVSFLPKGHTHEDIDQIFSETARALRIRNAFSIAEMAKILRTSYNPKPSVEVINNIANWSGLCKRTRCAPIHSHPTFSHFRFFKFMRSNRTTPAGTGSYATTCYVKLLESDAFEHQYRGNKGFLHFAPDLRKTPRLLIIRPDKVTEITKRLESVEDFIPNPSDRKGLLDLRDKVYKSRKQPFDWNLQDIPETDPGYGIENTPNLMSSTLDPADCLSDEEEDHVPHADYEYPSGNFVAVATTVAGKTSFWIAKIIDSCTNYEGVIHELRIVWYEPKNSTKGYDPTGAVYIESLTGNRTKRPYIDHVSVATVLCTFHGLTKQGKLDSNTRKRISAGVASFSS